MKAFATRFHLFSLALLAAFGLTFVLTNNLDRVRAMPGDAAMAREIGLAQSDDERRSAPRGQVVRLSSSGDVSILHRVTDQDGAPSQGNLLAANDGYFYGVTSDGGGSNGGTLFRLRPDGAEFVVLHVFSNMADGGLPLAGLIEGRDGYFYGTASQGGDHERGTVFQFSRDGRLRVLHAFDEGEGANPSAELLLAEDGFLYGTTSHGGRDNQGTIFRLDTYGHRFQIVYEFGLSDGANPEAGLIQTDDGWLVGVARAGGESHNGTVFRLLTDGSGFERLHAFAGFNAETGVGDGRHPLMVMAASDGYLYGTTLRGGDFNLGVVYRISPTGMDYAVLYSFTGEGDDPRLGLVTGPGGEISVPFFEHGLGDPTGGLRPLPLGQVIKGEEPTEPLLFVQSTITVTDETSLRNALATAMPGDTININVIGTMTLSGGELVVNKSLTINGQGAGQTVISGGNSSRVFFINRGAAGATVPPSQPFPVVRFSNLTIARGKAKGGDGGAGGISGPGGGGAGMGGGLFINGGTVTIDHVTFFGNQAIGGNGAPSSNQGGVGANGGGGFFSNGGPGSNTGVGGMGGAGGSLGSNGGSAGPGNLSGVGGVGGDGGEGGGGGGGGAWSANGGNGGFAGGGGGGASGTGNTGSFGGKGGNGGFGGGGGGGGGLGPTVGIGGTGGSFGGNGGTGLSGGSVSGGGGGGAGLGGAVFVRLGTLTLVATTFTSNSATRGNGGAGCCGATGGTNGQGMGGAVSINPGATVSGCNNVFSGNTATDGGNDVNGTLVGLGLPACDITGANAVCSGSTNNTYAGPAGLASYAWSISNGTIVGSTTGQAVNVTAGGPGSFTLTLTVTDANGCSSTCTKQVTVNAAPACSITGANAVCSGSTNNTYTGPAVAGLTYSWSKSGNATLVGLTTEQTVNVTAGGAGSFTLTLTVTDLNGCSSTCSTTVTVNAPACSITGANAVCESSTGNTFNGPVGAASYGWSISGNGNIVGSTTGQSVSVTATGAGSFTLTLIVTDANGCSSTCTKQVSVNEPPACSITGANAVCSGLTGNIYTGPAGAGLSYVWSISGNGTIPGSTTGQSVSVSAGAAGAFTLTVTLLDATGCTSTCSKQVTVNAPQPCSITGANIVCPSSIGNTFTGPAGNGVSYSWSITGNGSIAGPTTSQSVNVNGAGTGSFTLTLTVTNTTTTCSSTCSKQVSVLDTTPPSISCPPNQTASLGLNGTLCGAVVTYPAPTASDSCGGLGSPACSPASGSFFPVGTTTVTCSVKDASNNMSACTFTVAVIDTTLPTITCPQNIIRITARPGTLSVPVTFTTPVAGDNCAVTGVVCSPPSGSVFPVGVNTVTCTVTDTSGNPNQCSFTITVYDACLQDDSTAQKSVVFNTQTGDYLFCCAGTKVTGRGKVTSKGSIFMLEHYATTWRLTAQLDAAVKRGTASLQSTSVSCTVMDRNIADNTCPCVAQP